MFTGCSHSLPPSLTQPRWRGAAIRLPPFRASWNFSKRLLANKRCLQMAAPLDDKHSSDWRLNPSCATLAGFKTDQCKYQYTELGDRGLDTLHHREVVTWLPTLSVKVTRTKDPGDMRDSCYYYINNPFISTVKTECGVYQGIQVQTTLFFFGQVRGSVAYVWERGFVGWLTEDGVFLFKHLLKNVSFCPLQTFRSCVDMFSDSHNTVGKKKSFIKQLRPAIFINLRRDH